LTTQIFDRTDPHLEDDSVFAVDSLIVDFIPLKGNPEATLCNSILRTVYIPSIKSALGSQCVLLPVLLGDYSKAEGESEEKG
jgi:hypothetical protein